MATKRKTPDDGTLQLRRPPKRAAKSYIYDSLPPGQMRILVLSPGQREDPLQGVLETVNRTEKPEYKAISYAWGKPVFSHVLQLPQGRLLITVSLFDALGRFRSETEPVRLWADAVCIDQANTQEKNHQVAVMDQIYEEAEEVRVWLGEAQPSDCVALHTLLRLAGLQDDVVSMEPTDGLFHMFHGASDHTQCEACVDCGSLIELSPRRALSAVRSFWRRPWFTRLWVLQEIYSSTSCTFFFGDHNLPNTHVNHASSAWGVFLYCEGFDTRSELNTVGGDTDWVNVTNRMKRTRSDSPDLLTTLMLTRGFNASESA